MVQVVVATAETGMVGAMGVEEVLGHRRELYAPVLLGLTSGFKNSQANPPSLTLTEDFPGGYRRASSLASIMLTPVFRVGKQAHGVLAHGNSCKIFLTNFMKCSNACMLRWLICFYLFLLECKDVCPGLQTMTVDSYCKFLGLRAFKQLCFQCNKTSSRSALMGSARKSEQPTTE
eukprot:scaffold183939_cov18-Tisochrysis_lutea.AAC.1